MDPFENECETPTLGDEIAFLCETEDFQQVVNYFRSAEPYWLQSLELHPESCDYCREHYPALDERIEAIREVLCERALREIESMHRRFVEEFARVVAREEVNRHLRTLLQRWHLSMPSHCCGNYMCCFRSFTGKM